MAEPQSQTPRPDIRDEHLVRIGRIWFEAFCEEQHVPEDQRVTVSPVSFITWLPSQAAKWTAERLAEEANASHDSAEFMLALPGKTYGPNHVVALWPFLVHAHRDNPYPVVSVNLMCAIMFEDGVVVPLNMLAHRDVAAEPLDDARVHHLITTRTPDMANQFGVPGLKLLHDAHAARTKGIGSRAAIHYLKFFLETVPPATPEAAAAHEEAKRTIAFVEQLFPSEIPQAVKDAMAAKRKPADGGFNNNG